MPVDEIIWSNETWADEVINPFWINELEIEKDQLLKLTSYVSES